MEGTFEEKVVVVTGSSSGIGAAAVLFFAEHGARVVVNGRDEDNVKLTTEKCQNVAKSKDNIFSVIADVSIDSDCRKLIDLTIKRFGKLDVLVNNAGAGAITTMSDENVMDRFDEVMNNNLRSTLSLTHLAAEHLEKTRGVIINISSVTSMKPVAKWNFYCMAKAGVDMLTRCMALELGPRGIRVNSINPAAVKTQFFQRLGISKEDDEKAMEQRSKRYPLGRVGEPEDIAKVIGFLASGDSSYVNGINLLADGGSIWTGTSN